MLCVKVTMSVWCRCSVSRWACLSGVGAVCQGGRVSGVGAVCQGGRVCQV